jgi:acyl-CoA reductase-like NAD-dependent aldehyde dehydrogenase
MSSVPNAHDRESAMQTITKDYMDGPFVESHGREVMDSINGMRDDPQAPWGGFRPSCVGREFGTFGIEVFLEPRAILE